MWGLQEVHITCHRRNFQERRTFIQISAIHLDPSLSLSSCKESGIQSYLDA